MRCVSVVLAALVLSCLPRTEEAEGTRKSEVKEHVLSNGMKVLVIERDMSPIVAFSVWYKVGARDDPPGKSGLAHIIEHMLFKGTEKLSRDDCALLVQSSGGTLNAFTSYDMTCYHEVMPKDKLELAMTIESDRMANAAFRPGEFAPEIGVILNERAQRVDDSPTGLFRERLLSTAFKEHPYGRPIIGYPETIRSVTRDDAFGHYRRCYTPRNSFLVICGDVTAEEAFLLAEKHFGHIPPGPVVRPSVPRERAQDGERYLRMVSEKTSLAYLYYLYRGPRIGHRDEPALDMLAGVLADGRRSRLVRRLVDEEGLARGVWAYLLSSKDPNLFRFIVQLNPGAGMRRAGRILTEEVARVREELVTDEELQRAKNRLIAHDYYRREGTWNQAEVTGWLESIIGHEYLSVYVERALRVTAEDLKRSARLYFNSCDLTVGKLIPSRPVAGRAAPEEMLPRAAWQGGASILPTAVSPSSVKPKPLAPRTKTFELPNGVKLLVLANHRLPLVSVEGYVRAGAAYDPPGQSGLAEFTARSLRRGTRRHSYDELNDAIEFVGADVHFGSSLERVSFGCKSMKDDFDVIFAVLCEILTMPSFPERGVEREKRKLLASIAYAENDSGANAVWRFHELLYGSHPYSKRRLGRRDELARLGPEDLRLFHARRYRPEETVLCVVGDVRPEDVLKLARVHLADWRAAGEREPPLSRPGAFEGEKREFVPVPGKTQVEIVLGRSGVERRHPDYEALLLLDVILGGSDLTSRLGRALRVEGGSTYSVRSVFRAFDAGGEFRVSTSVAPEAFRETVEAVRKEVERFAADGPTEEEVSWAKNWVIGWTYRSADTNSQIASLLAAFEFRGLGLDYLDRFAEKVASAGREKLRELAREFLAGRDWILVAAGAVEGLDERER